MKFPSILTGRFLAYLIALWPIHLLAGEQATAVATVTAGYVTGIKVITGGSGYASEPAVQFSGGGGSGAAAKAVLSGDKVGQIIVLIAGSEYSAAPAVVIEEPPRETSLTIELAPKITVWGRIGSPHRVEWSATLGPEEMWQVLTNVTVGTDGVTVVDLALGSATRYYRAVTVTVPPAPSGMVLIPAGSFEMGDSIDTIEDAGRPVHSVFVSSFYMDKTEVTKALWDEVKFWSVVNGYSFESPGKGKAANHPVQEVSWYDVVKWCNARSEKDDRGPAYYTDAALTQVYKTGQAELYVKWDAGYRLPTEAEWEKAARGGASGHRFPWSDTDTITQSRANYFSFMAYSYDLNPTGGYHPTYAVGGYPFTSPVGSFPSNGYGLYDMAGNAEEWCWDWHGLYPSAPQIDPRGPDLGSHRVLRGGSWADDADYCGLANRNTGQPGYWGGGDGFRTAIQTATGGSGYSSEPAVKFSGGGGSGAAAKVILNGDKVGQIIVLNAGSGYSEAPAVAIDAPPGETSLTIELVPKITVWGQSGKLHRVESSATLGPEEMWQGLTNVTVGTDGVTVVDLAVGSATRFYRAVTVTVTVPPAPSGMVLIPAGLFEMGGTFSDGRSQEVPVHSVFVSAFYMDKTEVTKALWDEVKGWHGGNGYTFGNPGTGKEANHPERSVSWYDVVKWCNARSQKEGRMAAYYTDAPLTQIYKTGKVSPYVKWNAGYRLPTEAEWEKAARGGASGHRFPWSDADTIAHSRANYSSDSSYSYDISPTRGYHPTYVVGDYWHTSPAGSFAANGYGLYDMAGNVWEWCWDRYGSYSSGSQTDPRGPASGSARVIRGGSWSDYAIDCRSANRDSLDPGGKFFDLGFRSALSPEQP